MRAQLERGLRAADQQLRDSVSAHGATTQRLDEAQAALSDLQGQLATALEQREGRERELLQAMEEAKREWVRGLPLPRVCVPCR